MKFLLDENFPKTAEILLAGFDHQIIDIRGTEQQGMEDENLFELAQREQAVLLTTDRDFYHTIPFSYDKHFGVIVIALKQPNRAAILNRLRWFLTQDLLANIENTVYILRDRSYRVRRS